MKRDRNDFFGDAYEKATPVSLNIGRGKDYFNELDTDETEPRRKQAPAEETAPTAQDRSRERYNTSEPAKYVVEPVKEQPAAEKTAPATQDRSRERYNPDGQDTDLFVPRRRQTAAEEMVPAAQDRSRERYNSAEPARIEPVKVQPAEETVPTVQDRSRERYNSGEPARIEPVKVQPAAEKTAPASLDRSRERNSSEEQDTDLFMPRRRQPATEQPAKSYAGGSGSPRGYSRELKTPVSVSPRNYDRLPARGGSGGSGGGGGGQRKKGNSGKRRIPLAAIILIDVLVAVLLFLLFCQQSNFWIFDTSNQDTSDQSPTATVSEAATPSPSKTASATPTATGKQTGKPIPTPTATATADPNNWRVKFADKFSSDGKVHTQSTATSWSYQSANVDVNIAKHTENGVVYYVADIYVADIKYFRTSFGDGPDKEHTREFVATALKNVNGVVGINGDYYPDNGGLTIRNGQYYKYKRSNDDVLVMYTDGTMQAFLNTDFDEQSIKAQAPDKVWQVWGFGPTLLDSNGQPLTRFNTSMPAANPRTAIGYYEPGHYCFVQVEGRPPTNSKGMTISDLAQLMSSLHCKIAFNLDGGGSSQLAFMGNEINVACSDKRPIYDIIYITDQG